MPQFSSFARADDGAFCWQPGEIAGPFTVVVLAEDYTEVIRTDAIEGLTWQPTDELQAGQTYHAFVIGDQDHDTAKSQLLTFVQN